MGDLVPFDPGAVPPPFGQANTGAICYFNALLQALASCPSLVAAVAANPELLGKTLTGRALYNYMCAVREAASRSGFVVDATHSTRILAAMVADIRARRPGFVFGAGMESATEGLVFLLDMLEPPSEKAALMSEEQLATEPETVSEGQKNNPVYELFNMRIRNRLWCRSCQEAAGTPASGVISQRVDRLYQFNYMSYDAHPIRTPGDFVSHFKQDIEQLLDYKCEGCRTRAPSGAPSRVYRISELRRIPNIFVVTFNQYRTHIERYFPEEFELDGASGKKLKYRLVAQIEHAGSCAGGHYWTKALRKVDGALVPYALNDASVGPAPLGPNANVYTLFYHYAGHA